MATELIAENSASQLRGHVELDKFVSETQRLPATIRCSLDLGGAGGARDADQNDSRQSHRLHKAALIIAILHLSIHVRSTLMSRVIAFPSTRE